MKRINQLAQDLKSLENGWNLETFKDIVMECFFEQTKKHLEIVGFVELLDEDSLFFGEKDEFIYQLVKIDKKELDEIILKYTEEKDDIRDLLKLKDFGTVWINKSYWIYAEDNDENNEYRRLGINEKFSNLEMSLVAEQFEGKDAFLINPSDNEEMIKIMQIIDLEIKIADDRHSIFYKEKEIELIEKMINKSNEDKIKELKNNIIQLNNEINEISRRLNDNYHKRMTFVRKDNDWKKYYLFN